MNLSDLGTSCKWNLTVFLFSWLVVSLTITSTSFIHVATCVSISFLFNHEKHCILLHSTFCLPIHLPLALVNTAAMNMEVLALWIPAYVPFGYIPEVPLLPSFSCASW
jgi:hypothetical protein